MGRRATHGALAVVVSLTLAGTVADAAQPTAGVDAGANAIIGGDTQAIIGGDRIKRSLRSDAIIGGDRSAIIGGDTQAIIGGDRIKGSLRSDAIIGGDRSVIIDGDTQAMIGGDRIKRSLRSDAIIGGDRSAIIGGDTQAIIGGDRTSARSALVVGLDPYSVFSRDAIVAGPMLRDGSAVSMLGRSFKLRPDVLSLIESDVDSGQVAAIVFRKATGSGVTDAHRMIMTREA